MATPITPVIGTVKAMPFPFFIVANFSSSAERASATFSSLIILKITLFSLVGERLAAPDVVAPFPLHNAATFSLPLRGKGDHEVVDE